MTRSQFEGVYSVQQASAATGVTTTNIHYWTGPAHVITPEVAHPQIQRSPKEFSVENLVELAVLKLLSERGVGLDAMRGLQQTVRPAWRDLTTEASEILVFTEGKSWHYLKGSPEQVQEQLVKELLQGRDAVVINLGQVKKELRAKV
jgi:hypothetical protein